MHTIASVSPFVWAHLLTVLPAALLGTWLMAMRKGTAMHRLLGRLYLGLMALTACLSFTISAQVGPTWLGHVGWIHGLSVLVLVTVPLAYRAARRGQIQQHRTLMLGLYLGGIWLAGLLAFAPGRLLHRWLFALI